MQGDELVLEAILEVDVNSIMKVTAVEKSTGRSVNITLSNSIGRLSSEDIEKMISNADEFKQTDEELAKRHESKQKLEDHVSSIELTVTDSVLSGKLKRGSKDTIKEALSTALAILEIEESSADDYRKAESGLKRVVIKERSAVIPPHMALLAVCNSDATAVVEDCGHHTGSSYNIITSTASCTEAAVFTVTVTSSNKSITDIADNSDTTATT